MRCLSGARAGGAAAHAHGYLVPRRRLSTAAAGLHGSRNLPAAQRTGETFYLTTAINYTNGPPHVGHAYEAVLADVCARHQRLAGKEVYFLTGSDEHGQKIANRAKEQDIPVEDYCTGWVTCFQGLNERLLVSNDRYIRTSEAAHKATCQALWRRCAEAGDIYYGQYEGWYNEREELFVPDAEAERDDYKDADGVPLKRVSEPCYFFRLSKYHAQLEAFLREVDGGSGNVVFPEACRTQALDLLKQPLRDLCISRTAFTWGVPTPAGTEEGHVMYVWFDALTNYLSAAVSGLDVDGDACGREGAPTWPADLHIVGKDIIRFHCLFWPAMLWSAGLAPPKRVWAHGFVNDAGGRKMSKSLGNVTCPLDVLAKYPPDTVRFFLCSEAGCGGDLKLSQAGLLTAHNQVLADTVGNLLQRVAVLTQKMCGGVIPEAMPSTPAHSPTFPYPYSPPFCVDALRERVCAGFDACDVRVALQAVLEAFRDTNKWLTDLEPWKLEKGSPLQASILRHLAEAAYALAHFLAPYLPQTAAAVFTKLSTPGVGYHQLSAGFDVLVAGTPIAEGDWTSTGGKTLFPKFEADETAVAKPPQGKKGKGQDGGKKKQQQHQQQQKGDKKEKKQKHKKKGGEGKKEADAPQAVSAAAA